MATDTARHSTLPKDIMSMQLDQIDLLQAMYAPDDAISIESTSVDASYALKAWCESEGGQSPIQPPSTINMVLTLDSPDTEGTHRSGDERLRLNLSVPLTFVGEVPTEPPPTRARLQQPSWLSKAQVANINSSLPEEDILAVIEHVKDVALAYANEASQAPVQQRKLFDGDSPVIRVWFYFPSISTRAKRDDLVNNAPHYGLTGFLLAGKPGILCLEGGSVAIDDFMKFIKTDSWGDIPSQHKKVSERHRETGAGLQRTFIDMEEITETVGERRGERANRSDMKALEAWLTERGLGETLSKVLM